MTNVHVQLIAQARFSPQDLAFIGQRRREYNRLGVAYQLGFIRLNHRFPAQLPTLEIMDDLLAYVGAQLGIDISAIETYQARRQTIAEHRMLLLDYLGLRRFQEHEAQQLEAYLFQEACRLEQTGPLLAQAKRYLRQQGVLFPADDTLRRMISTQRQAARDHIYARITDTLSGALRDKLDRLLLTDNTRYSPFQILKQPPGNPSPNAILRLADKLEQIEATGVLAIDLGWLNNNYQRALSRYAQRCSADRLRELKTAHRYAVMVCFLRQHYRDTIDFVIETHHKIMTRVHHRAQTEIDTYDKQQRRDIRQSLKILHTLGTLILDESIADQALRQTFFDQVDKDSLIAQIATIQTWLTGRHSHAFHRVVQRFTYLRQFAPTLLQALQFRLEDGVQSSIVEAVHLLQTMNAENRRKLPEDVPLDFIPKTLRPLIERNGQVERHAWECAVLSALQDEIRAGNVFVDHSRHFGRFNDFFMPLGMWEQQREGFFQRAGLPLHARDVPDYLQQRLSRAYDRFLATLPENVYAQIQEGVWVLSTDPSDKLGAQQQQQLEALKDWLAKHLRDIKLPELLIEVDNELRFTRHFMPTAQQDQREPEMICRILATVIAHGCNVGPYTMARLTQGITYAQIKQITDWQITEDAQRQALAQIVNAITRLDVTQVWGQGKSSSSDGQRFPLNRKILQRTYSHRLRDYALEFYSFVADNYAPFYNTVIECTDRDAAYVLDGLLYNESDLPLEEHYTDTHGYTEINFAAFAMLGRRFAPRIRQLHRQRIYRIDKGYDYGALSPLVERHDRLIHLDWIAAQWDRMGHFYASLEQGHTTASTALKRLVGYTGRNHFYRANRELGRIFKTEHILQYMSDPALRKRTQRGLLKSEEVHALARQVAYGKQGRMTTQDLYSQPNAANCLTLIMACIIYWQAKEIHRVLNEVDMPETLDWALLEHISPAGWDNIILYGEYFLNQHLVRT
jgi:TnpA family transposase